MQYFFPLALLFSVASVSLAERCTVGPCLPDPGLSCIQKCDDGTDGTPCCGVGGCNIFCFNCDGGCRQGDTNANTKRGSSSQSGDPDSSSQNGDPDDDESFAKADVDGSGNVTMAQYMAYIQPGLNMKLWMDRFHQHDKNGDGVISPNEMRLSSSS